MMLEPGKNLGHYRRVEKIGEGGMGVVWKAVAVFNWLRELEESSSAV